MIPVRVLLVASFAVLLVACSAAPPSAPEPDPGAPAASPDVLPTASEPLATVSAGADRLAGPAGRGYLDMTSIDNTGVMLFGGFATPPHPDGDGYPLLDAWLLADAARGWRRAADAPLGGDTIAYDSQSGRVLAYVIFEDDWEVVDPELWAFDPSADRWEQMAADGVPGGMWAPHLAYDSESDRTVLIGPPDPSPGPDSATWAYDYESDAWTDMAPVAPMPRRWFPTIAYDPGCDRVIVFGGFPDPGSDETTNETWSYDLNANTWTELIPEVSPSARAYAAMAYDPALERMILFGGQPYPSSIGDTWAFDCRAKSWRELATDQAPPARGKHAMAHNPVDGTIVLFGGATIVGGGPDWEAEPAGTWIFDPTSDSWSPLP